MRSMKAGSDSALTVLHKWEVQGTVCKRGNTAEAESKPKARALRWQLTVGWV